MRTPPHNPLPSARPRLSVRAVTSSQFEYKKRVYWKNPAKPGRSPDCSANYAPCYCARKITADAEGWALWSVNYHVVTTSRCYHKWPFRPGRMQISEKQCKETAATLGLTYGGPTPPEQNFPHGCVRRATTHQPPLPCEAAPECAYQRLSSNVLAAAPTSTRSTGRTPTRAGGTPAARRVTRRATAPSDGE